MLALGRLGAKYRGVSKAGLATPLRAALLLPSKGTVNRDRCLSIKPLAAAWHRAGCRGGRLLRGYSFEMNCSSLSKLSVQPSR